MISVQDARKAVQIIQYSIRGMAEIFVAGEKANEGLITDAATGVLSAASMLDFYLTGDLSARASRRDADAQSAIRFLSLMAPFRFTLSSPGMVITFSWPRDGAEIFQLEGDDENVLARWRKLFSDEGEGGVARGLDPPDVPEA